MNIKPNLFSKLHTCDHILCGILEKECEDFQVYGLQITKDVVRFPFKVKELPEKITSQYLEDEVNRIIARGLSVTFETVNRKEAERRKINLSLVPKSSDKISLATVQSVNTQACLGPHVKNTKEIADIGSFKILKFEKNGKNAYQITATIKLNYDNEDNILNNTKMKKLKTKYITPKRLSGFQDFFAKDMKLREFVIDTFKKTFEKFGYEPLETPALEYSELMLGQSGKEAEKQYYRFRDNGGRDVMLKYEVMIAMCRAVAQNLNNVPMPYKRYQIQRVWRAEKVQKGRYREFTQCDADTIGSSSMLCDGEFIQMGLEIVGKFGFKEFVARISNRKFLEGLAEYLKVPKEKFYDLYISIDKLEKIGTKGVIKEIIARGISDEIAKETLKLLNPEVYKTKSNEDTIKLFEKNVGTTKIGAEGLKELNEILKYLQITGLDENTYKFDPSIARGLASYSGPVWEFTVIDGGVGSIGGCGRYDKAIGKYLGKDIPATGGSFGIERICDIIKDRKMLDLGETTVNVMVTLFNEQTVSDSIKTAENLRKEGFMTMLYPNIVKLDKQFKYADKKGIPYVVVIGPDEIKEGKVVVKDMKSGKQEKINFRQLFDKLRNSIVEYT